jgi:hypothetical protein
LARRHRTLIDLSLRRQERAASRQALYAWWRKTMPQGVVWSLALAFAVLAVAGIAWRIFR